LFDGHKKLAPSQRFSYQELFRLHTGLNPLIFSYQDYCSYAVQNQLPEAVNICGHDHAAWLDLIFSHVIQPKLGEDSVCMVYGYPACQSSLARINSNDSLITDRVEVFINGIELGNGYYELADAEEQERRFVREIAIRQQKNRPIPVKDQRLVAAIRAGLPDCSGMAIGLDRLLMLLAERLTINEVVSFPIQRA
jgi:elongation factor P--(R)-beta-lysine ligase